MPLILVISVKSHAGVPGFLRSHERYVQFPQFAPRQTLAFRSMEYVTCAIAELPV
jgi:hypothetical protein